MTDASPWYSTAHLEHAGLAALLLMAPVAVLAFMIFVFPPLIAHVVQLTRKWRLELDSHALELQLEQETYPEQLAATRAMLQAMAEPTADNLAELRRVAINEECMRRALRLYNDYLMFTVKYHGGEWMSLADFIETMKPRASQSMRPT